MRIYFVTGSERKFAEIASCLDILKARMGISLEMKWIAYNVPETLDLNIDKVVRGKAIAAYRQVGVPCVVEHSGLFMDALTKLPEAEKLHALAEMPKSPQMPGVLGKMIWDAIDDRICNFLREGDSREANAISVLAYCDGKQIHIYRGETRGQIAEQKRGAHGFNWDSIFIPEGSTQTYAEMGTEKKLETAPSLKAWEAFLKAELSGSRPPPPSVH